MTAPREHSGGTDAADEVWVIAGDEGHVYGIVATEADAWEFVGREARQGIFECSDTLPESVTYADEVELHWLIRASDKSRGRVLIPAEKYPHDMDNQSIWGRYWISPQALPVASFCGDATEVTP